MVCRKRHGRESVFELTRLEAWPLMTPPFSPLLQLSNLHRHFWNNRSRWLGNGPPFPFLPLSLSLPFVCPHLRLYPLCSHGRRLFSRLTHCIPASFVSPSTSPLVSSPPCKFDLLGQHFGFWSAVSLHFGLTMYYSIQCIETVLTHNLHNTV